MSLISRQCRLDSAPNLSTHLTQVEQPRQLPLVPGVYSNHHYTVSTHILQPLVSQHQLSVSLITTFLPIYNGGGATQQNKPEKLCQASILTDIHFLELKSSMILCLLIFHVKSKHLYSRYLPLENKKQEMYSTFVICYKWVK